MQEGLSKLLLCTVVLDGRNSCTDIFKFDPNYLENEEKYKAIKAEILSEDSEDESGSEEESSGKEEEGRVDALFVSLVPNLFLVEEQEGIQDQTETNLVNLQQMIYLMIMNALKYEEVVHKLLKVQIREGKEASSANLCAGISQMNVLA